jgi:pimeloyl-ACP methyl ester carboxylesterase
VPLTSLRLLAALATASLTSLAGAIIWCTRPGLARRRRLLTAGACAVAALVLATATVLAGINQHYALYRSWSELLGPDSKDLVSVQGDRQLQQATAVATARPDRPHGTLLDLRIPPTASHLPALSSYVYLPEQYRLPAYQHTRFPVVEAFNGSPGRPSDWLNGIRADQQLDQAVAAGTVAPAIVVFAPTNTGWLRSLECSDTRDGLRDESYLTIDVPHWVDTHLRAVPSRWTAMGFSTGGYCALELALRHPDRYAHAVSLDGYGRALQDHYARGLWRSRQDRLEHSPDWWILHHRVEPLTFFLSAGTGDHDDAYDALRTWRALTAAGWLTRQDQLRVEPHGHHTFRDWEREFLPALEWALPGTADGDVLQPPAVARLAATLPSPRPMPTSTTPTPTPAASPAASTPRTP